MAAVLFDATRMFLRATRSSPTGIDRVTRAYALWLLGRQDVDLIPVCTWGGRVSAMSRRAFEAILERGSGEPVSADRDWDRLAAALTSPGAGAPTLRARPERAARLGAVGRYLPAGARTLAGWRPARLPHGAIYLNVSHFGLEQRGLMARLTALGARPVVMIHDLIPIVHPEFCGPSAARWHLRRIEAVLEHATLVITNSASTAVELVEHARRFGRRTPPIQVAPLGLEPAFLRPRGDALQAPPYFVCIGTIEPRKNLAFLLTLWRRLVERLGERAPVLVLAGRRGWENEAVIDLLDRSPPVRRFVHEAVGLGDDEIASLIGGAAALLAPSFSEGFDLPVAEALALGTPVIASDIPVHRELARGAQLIDPLHGPAWLAAIEAAASVRPTASVTAPLGWPDHFAIVADALKL